MAFPGFADVSFGGGESCFVARHAAPPRMRGRQPLFVCGIAAGVGFVRRSRKLASIFLFFDGADCVEAKRQDGKLRDAEMGLLKGFPC